mgnify:CR=1 FL=1
MSLPSFDYEQTDRRRSERELRPAQANHLSLTLDDAIQRGRRLQAEAIGGFCKRVGSGVVVLTKRLITDFQYYWNAPRNSLNTSSGSPYVE